LLGAAAASILGGRLQEPAMSPVEAVPEPPAVVRVLVVDDHAAVRAGLTRLLEAAAGFAVVGEAADGEEAVAAAGRLVPDVVLLDVTMPVLDGVGALPLLRALPSPPAVVLFTAWADQPRIEAARALGATQVLKDAEPEEVLAALRRAVRPEAAAPALRPLPGPGDDAAAGDEPTQVRRAAAGDPDAWERLYRTTHPKIHAYVRRRLPGAEVGDAVSETFLRAVRGLGGFSGSGSGFDAWVYGIARHVVLDAQRRAARQRMLRADRGVADGEPLQAVLDTEESAAARRAFARLGASDRELLELRVIGGLSADEAAAVLGSRPGSVRMAQTRALRRLRDLLDDELGGEAPGEVLAGAR
jgi:RNA polymerase sigma-70 factor (ECF subfamily)